MHWVKVSTLQQSVALDLPKTKTHIHTLYIGGVSKTLDLRRWRQGNGLWLMRKKECPLAVPITGTKKSQAVSLNVNTEGSRCASVLDGTGQSAGKKGCTNGTPTLANAIPLMFPPKCWIVYECVQLPRAGGEPPTGSVLSTHRASNGASSRRRQKTQNPGPSGSICFCLSGRKVRLNAALVPPETSKYKAWLGMVAKPES
jgi:hypothetical protein